MSFTTRTTCRLCSGPLRTVLELEPTPPANALVPEVHWCPYANEVAYPLTLAQCEQCRHVQLREALDPSLLFTADYAYQSATSPVFREHLQRLARQVQSKLFPGDLIVEIGSNDGYLLQQFDPHFRTLGVDPASALAAAATKQGRLTYPGFFNVETAKAIERATGRATRILALNVFAHLSDPRSVAEGVRGLLAETGELVLEVGYLPDVIRTNNWPVVYHEHMDQWALGPMVAFFASQNLYLYDAERVNTQGGSVRAFVSKKPKHFTERCAVMLEDERGLQAELDEWPARVAESRQAIGDAVRALKDAGHTICGYGAAAKSTTLLHSCGLGRKELDCIFELNRSKVGRFTPGTHVPIVWKEELETRAPDYVLMLSGNFSDAIQGQHPEYLGKWIEPLPEVRVVDG